MFHVEGGTFHVEGGRFTLRGTFHVERGRFTLSGCNPKYTIVKRLDITLPRCAHDVSTLWALRKNGNTSGVRSPSKFGSATCALAQLKHLQKT